MTGEAAVATRDDRLFKVFVVFILLGTFFPYIKFLPLPTDTQPTALVGAAMFFCLFALRAALPLSIWLLGAAFAWALCLFVASGPSLDGIRSMLGYCSVFVIAVAGYLSVLRHGPINPRLIDFAIVVWFLVGAVEWATGSEFLPAITSGNRTTETRGFNSLAPEPGFYGTMMVFFWLLLTVRGRQWSWQGVLCLVQTVLFAQSAMAVLCLLGLVVVDILFKTKVWGFVVVLVVCVTTILLLESYAEAEADVRLIFILNLILQDPIGIILLDESVNSRAAGIFFSVHGAINSYFMPSFFDTFPVYTTQTFWDYKDLFWYQTEHKRIQSGYGGALYELGFFGLIFPVVTVLAVVRRGFCASIRVKAVLLCGLGFVMLMATPVAHPFFGLLLGYLLGYGRGGHDAPGPAPAPQTHPA